MPIANCFVRRNGSATPDPDAVIREWVVESRIQADEMTVNVSMVDQGGQAYSVMAWLYLPSSWSPDDIARLSRGLALALSREANVEPSAVLVITLIVESGSVVDSGDIVCW